MYYHFPKIEHIDDILPSLRDYPEFIVADRGDYKIINYMIHKSETFAPTPIERRMRDTDMSMKYRRECRGIVFNKDGTILSRRFHKFFNVGEKEETLPNNIDLTQNHVILDKLDGSMITPLVLDGQVYWATKMGHLTDVAISCARYANTSDNPLSKNYVGFALECHELGWTPIFEWCSRKNRIVIDYPEDQLILTAMRKTVEGWYMDQNTLELVGQFNNIPVVKSYGTISDINAFIEKERYNQGMEGFVIRFNNGHMLKIKCDEYVLCHRSKDTVSKPRHVVQAILNETVDDLKAFLVGEDRDRVDVLEKMLWDEIEGLTNMINNSFDYYSKTYGDRKTFALNIGMQLDKTTISGIFWVWSGKDARDYIKNIFMKATGADIDWSKHVEYFKLDKKVFLPNG